MNEEVRERALHVLRCPENATRTVVHNAVIDLRRNAKHGDEAILAPLLNHSDPMVVAATLYTLCEVHNQQDALRSLLERLVRGDSRDSLEMPIQSMAVSLLASFGKNDKAAIATLRETGENCEMASSPRKRAWQELAALFDVEWHPKYTEEMLLFPESEVSEQIRHRIRMAME